MKSAIIGCGNIAPCHINAILKCGGEVGWLCDVDTDKCEALKKEFGLDCAIYSDYAALLEEAAPFCVHICTPHYLHKEMVIAALNKNINVLCEKPLCMSGAELAEIKAAAAKSSAVAGVCHQNRFSTVNTELFFVLQDKTITGAYANVVWNRDRKYYQSAPWRGKRGTEGGGVLINQALHTLDLIIKICGMPEFVTGHISNDSLKGVIEVEDTANALLSCGGVNVSFYATLASSFNFPVLMSFHADGETYTVTDGFILKGSKKQEIKNRNNSIREYWGDGHVNLIENFYGCINECTPFEVDIEEGGKVIRVIESIYLSYGKKIKI